jgi:Ser/Thr protein kinase RdoA (MazF antagonist)
MSINAIAHAYCQTFIATRPLGNGLINDTFEVLTPECRFVLQKINHKVFPEPEKIMVNLEQLNRHVKNNRQDSSRLVIPELLKTTNNALFVIDDHGDYWRAWEYIEQSVCLETLQNLDQAQEVGKALACFHKLTETLSVTTLCDSLPGFHIAPDYFNNYQCIKAQSHIQEDRECADFIDKHSHLINDLEDAKNKGLLPVRTIHGDPKLNNFLFDQTAEKIVSLIDLDTVKPGLIHYDIGDCVRSCCHLEQNDDFNMDVCREVLTGYCQIMGEALTQDDYRFIYPAIRLIPFELGIRFYTDYLDGNRYFKVNKPDDNLRRAQQQFRLCQSIIQKKSEIINIINKFYD